MGWQTKCLVSREAQSNRSKDALGVRWAQKRLSFEVVVLNSTIKGKEGRAVQSSLNSGCNYYRILRALVLTIVLILADKSALSNDLIVDYPDQYPVEYQNQSPNSVDPFCFYFRECTSYVAWKINMDAGFSEVLPPCNCCSSLPPFRNGMNDRTSWGWAHAWNDNAENIGFPRPTKIPRDQVQSRSGIVTWDTLHTLSLSTSRTTQL